MTGEETESLQTRDWSLPQLSDQEFALFQALVYRQAGISLGPTKKALVFGRLSKRVRDLNLNSFTAYYRRVSGVDADAAELQYMVDCICTNETHFFRDPRHFEFLASHVYPEWHALASAGKRPKRIKAWSCACSTGEEPFTLAMELLKHFGPGTGWQIEIAATDLSTKVLTKAKEAVWPLAKSKEIPPEYLKEFMLRGTGPQDGKMKAGPEIRSLVQFQQLNLMDDSYAVSGPFDVVFCRNVMIYFDYISKKKVVERLVRHLAPGGYFILGSAESLNGVTDQLKNMNPSIYRNRAI